MSQAGAPFTLATIREWLSRHGLGERAEALLPRRWRQHDNGSYTVQLEPGERELFRTNLRGAGLLVAYQPSRLWSGLVCVVTDQRLILESSGGDSMRFPLGNICAAHPRRSHDRLSGFTYWVAVYRVGSDFSESRGDIWLWCTDNVQAHELAWHIQNALPSRV